MFKRVKTGPLPFNVEYQLQVLKCKQRPLTEEERALVAAAKVVDEKYPRSTPAEVLATLEKITKGDSDGETATATEAEAVKDLH